MTPFGDQLVEKFLPYARWLVGVRFRTFVRRCEISLDDARQCAYLALVQCVQEVKPGKFADDQFRAFVMKVCFHRLVAQARLERRVIIPAGFYKTARRLRSLRAQMDRWPTTKEAASALSVSIKEASHALRFVSAPPDTLLDAEDDWLAKELHSDSVDIKRQFLLQSRFEQVLNSLTNVQQLVISMRYGFEDGYVYSLTEVSRKIGKSSERVRQIEGKALRKLQQPFLSKYLEPLLPDNSDDLDSSEMFKVEPVGAIYPCLLCNKAQAFINECCTACRRIDRSKKSDSIKAEALQKLEAVLQDIRAGAAAVVTVLQPQLDTIGSTVLKQLASAIDPTCEGVESTLICLQSLLHSIDKLVDPRDALSSLKAAFSIYKFKLMSAYPTCFNRSRSIRKILDRADTLTSLPEILESIRQQAQLEVAAAFKDEGTTVDMFGERAAEFIRRLANMNVSTDPVAVRETMLVLAELQSAIVTHWEMGIIYVINNRTRPLTGQQAALKKQEMDAAYLASDALILAAYRKGQVDPNSSGKPNPHAIRFADYKKAYGNFVWHDYDAVRVMRGVTFRRLRVFVWGFKRILKVYKSLPGAILLPVFDEYTELG